MVGTITRLRTWMYSRWHFWVLFVTHTLLAYLTLGSLIFRLPLFFFYILFASAMFYHLIYIIIFFVAVNKKQKTSS